MSRCQHGQLITQFCLSDSCNWREAGGCQNCLKKYHSHLQGLDTVSIDKIDELTRIFNTNPQIKMKSKIIQETVYNYFIIMKSQISASIDTVSRVITNKLGYPYLSSQGQINVYKKLKYKQYKKISKKQLKSFYNFVNSQNSQIVQLNEKKLYLDQISQLVKVMNGINGSFQMYAQAIQKLDSSFNLQKSFFNKMLQISAAIQHQNTVNKTSKVGSGRFYADFEKQKKSEQNQNNYQKVVKKTSSNRDRKVSIDAGVGLQFNKFVQPPLNQNFHDNQKQISEKKKKLFDMLKNPIQKQENKCKNNQSQNLVNLKNAVQQSSQKNVEVLKQQKLISILYQQEKDKKNIGLSQSSNKSSEQTQEIKIQEDLNQKAANQLFQQLISKGINLPEFIAHTILPREASRQKLYEDSKDVKQRKITIPVKKYEESEQNSSPLLRRKRQKKNQSRQGILKQQNQQQMNKLSLFQRKDGIDEKTSDIRQNQFSTPQKQKQSDENTQKMLLKDREADSVALLLQSLPLSAQKAIPLLEAAIKFAYNNLSAAQYLSYLYLEVGKPKSCLQLCNKMLEQLQDSPQANELSVHISNNKAAALNMLGRYSESIGILERCLAYSKRDIYYKNLADAYFSIAIYEKASRNYEQAIQLNSYFEEAYYNVAVCYYMQDHYHQAQLNVMKALKINPKNQQYLLLSREIMIKINN